MRETSSTVPPADPRRIPGLEGASDHLVQFYSDAPHLSDTVARFLGEGLDGADLLLVIATEPHQRAFRERLEAKGFDVAAAIESGRLTFLDAQQTLAQLLRAGEPDAARFGEVIGGLVARKMALLPGSARLRAYGEMVDLLWQAGKRDSAIRLEELWNELQHRHSFTLLCAYAMANFYREPSALDRVCRVHSHVVGEQTPEGGVPAAHRLAQEIAHREEVEQALRTSLRELRRKEAALRESQQQLEQITDALPTLVSYVDAERRYRFVSASYERWFGHPKSDQVGGDRKARRGGARTRGVRGRQALPRQDFRGRDREVRGRAPLP